MVFSSISFLFLSTSYNTTESLSKTYPAISTAWSTSPPPLFLKSIIRDCIFCFCSSSNLDLKSSAVVSSNDVNAIYPILFSNTLLSTGFTFIFSLFTLISMFSLFLNIVNVTSVPSSPFLVLHFISFLRENIYFLKHALTPFQLSFRKQIFSLIFLFVFLWQCLLLSN